ncbi:MAG: transposase [Phormidesmis sp. FL-bin-119]|nr:transposase [Pedobacter sp.]
MCIVHMVGNSLYYLGCQKRKEMAPDLKCVYTASTIDKVELYLTEFETVWEDTYSPIAQS